MSKTVITKVFTDLAVSVLWSDFNLNSQVSSNHLKSWLYCTMSSLSQEDDGRLTETNLKPTYHLLSSSPPTSHSYPNLSLIGSNDSTSLHDSLSVGPLSSISQSTPDVYAHDPWSSSTHLPKALSSNDAFVLPIKFESSISWVIHHPSHIFDQPLES